MTRAVRVSVRCEHRYSDTERCNESDPSGHIHQPAPCGNRRDDRHHAYLPPKSVLLDIAGQARRVRLDQP